MSEEFLAHYRIIGQIGAGGMGSVYRATDTKLGREVAVKVLPESFANDPDRLSRFRREARLLASLNHPNVLTIHEAGVDQEVPYLVSELLEGESLRHRLDAAGPNKGLTIEEALSIGRQIAEGLAAAHAANVIHRDLKPENLWVTSEGRVKILDFGIARTLSGDARVEPGSGEGVTNATTEFTTAPGRIVGTNAYMAPEQVRGQDVDVRTDVFALGCVLYEMFSGKMAFRRESGIETLSAVLETDPTDLSQVREDVPLSVELLVARCLEKQADKRFQSTRDLAFALGAAEKVSNLSPLHQVSKLDRSNVGLSWRAIATGCAVILACLAGFLLFDWSRSVRTAANTPAGPLRKVGLFLTLGQEEAGPLSFRSLQIAPDGRKFLFVDHRGLWLSRLDQLSKPTLLVESDAIRGCSWAPDSRRAAYVADWFLYRIDTHSRVANVVTEVGYVRPGGVDGVWTHQDQFILETWLSDIVSVDLTSGEITKIIPRESGEKWFGRVSPLPNDLGIVFPIFGEEGMAQIDAWTPSGGRVTLLREEQGTFRHPTYSPTGHILFVRTGDSYSLWAFPLSLATLERTGAPFRVGAGTSPSFSSDGTMLVNLTSPEQRQLVWVDRTGQVVSSVGQPLAGLSFGKISPDNQLVVASAVGNNSAWKLWLVELETDRTQLLSRTIGSDLDPHWFPDSETILHRRWFNGVPRTVKRSVLDLSSGEELIEKFPIQLTADGKTVLIWDTELEEKGYSYFRLDQNPYSVFRFPKAFWDTNHLVLSPDGRLLAYFSDDTGVQELYVVEFPSFTNRQMVSVGGASQSAAWHPSGSELYFRDATKKSLMSTTVDRSSGLDFAAPVELFELPVGIEEIKFDVDSSGRFLMIQNLEEPNSPEPDVLLIENWLQEFEERAEGE